MLVCLRVHIYMHRKLDIRRSEITMICFAHFIITLLYVYVCMQLCRLFMRNAESSVDLCNA
jgi:hypothetical protein